MNRIILSRICLVCGTDLWALLRTRSMESADRQMENGMCDGCQKERYLAAIEYERACTAVRQMISFGATSYWGNPPRPNQMLTEAMARIEVANTECVRLKMWPATERSTTK